MVNQHKQVAAMFGGSFDPPHRGHQRIVEEALKALEIDRLLIVPAYINPFKKSSYAPASQRLEWCHTLFDEIEKVKVDDYEIQEGNSTTTSQSIKYFSTLYDVKYLIVGSDNLPTLAQWHQFEWLNDHIEWVIATRDEAHLNVDPLKKWRFLHLDVPVSSTTIRETKDMEYIDKRIQSSVRALLKEH